MGIKLYISENINASENGQLDNSKMNELMKKITELLLVFLHKPGRNEGMIPLLFTLLLS